MTATLEPTAATGGKASPGTSPADVIRRAKEAGVQIVDVRFTDLPGTWQHFSTPLKELEEDTFKEGLGFDGSSIRGWKSIEASDIRRRAERPGEQGCGDPGRRALPEPPAGTAAFGCLLPSTRGASTV